MSIDEPRRIDPEVEWADEVCGIYFRTIVLPKKGDKVPRHSHHHDHATYVAMGSVKAWEEDECLGEFEAGEAIPMRAGYDHEFEALEDQTRIACVHAMERAPRVKGKQS